MTLGESGTLYGTISVDDDGSDILQQINQCLKQFHTMVGLNLKEIDTASTTNAPPFNFCNTFPTLCNLGTNVQSSLFVIIIAIVLVIIFLSTSKNIKIGI